MLTECPECKERLSSQAAFCPHCGYVIKTEVKKTVRRRKKRRRLPNGFGQISEIKGQNLKKPFRAMVTVGKNENGRPICRLLQPEAYFETYNEAYTALLEYNKDPFDLNKKITMGELYDKWFEETNSTRSESNKHNIRSGWKYCTSVYDVPVREVRVRHIRKCIEEGTITYRGSTHTAPPFMQERIKLIFNALLDYAVENELTDKNYSRGFKLRTREESTQLRESHINYTDEEMKILWDHAYDMPLVDTILIQCYTGFRPQELGDLLLENVDLENWLVVGGMKTDAGKNRTVPIHPAIREFVKKHYDKSKEVGSKYLIHFTSTARGRKANDCQLCYERYKYAFDKTKINLNLNPKHRLHDARVQFVTMAKKYNVDEYAIKLIVGHVITDITEKVYTKRTPTWLMQELCKI